jgi:membrane-associated phospholipid phosphatase
VYCRYHYGVDVLAGLVAAALLIPLGNWLYWKFEKEAGANGSAGDPATGQMARS